MYFAHYYYCSLKYRCNVLVTFFCAASDYELRIFKEHILSVYFVYRITGDSADGLGIGSVRWTFRELFYSIVLT